MLGFIVFKFTFSHLVLRNYLAILIITIYYTSK